MSDTQTSQTFRRWTLTKPVTYRLQQNILSTFKTEKLPRIAPKHQHNIDNFAHHKTSRLVFFCCCWTTFDFISILITRWCFNVEELDRPHLQVKGFGWVRPQVGAPQSLVTDGGQLKSNYEVPHLNVNCNVWHAFSFHGCHLLRVYRSRCDIKLWLFFSPFDIERHEWISFQFTSWESTGFNVCLRSSLIDSS